MRHRLLATFLLIFLPLSAHAVYFPDGIDWTHPSQSRFVQSLYLNMLGRAPDPSETRQRVRDLRTNDNRTARLRIFESISQLPEYQSIFNDNSRSWQIYRAPDYNYNNGVGFWRYEAAANAPENFQNLPGNRAFSEAIAHSLANYYNAFCYRGEPCINNPELARDRGSNVLPQTTSSRAHACADPTNLTSQYKWVAINGTTYPRGIGRNTICMEDSYYETDQLALKHYQCESGFENCRRNPDFDIRASRAGTDNNGNASLFFRDGSRLAVMEVDAVQDNAGVIVDPQTDSELLFNSNAHECADNTKTTSRFTWKGTTRTVESKGIGANTVCMENYYYAVERLTLVRHQCSTGFTDCQPDPKNNIKAERRTRVDGNPGLLFANGTTLSLTARGVSPTNTTLTDANNTRPIGDIPVAETQPQMRIYNGSDCADATKRVSQFKWKSSGLNSWPDGVGGRFICQTNSYYEIEQSRLRYYTCEINYTNCRANPRKDINISQVSQDGSIWALSNGDQLTLISK